MRAAAQSRPRTRQRSRRRGMMSPARWVGWRGPTSREAAHAHRPHHIEIPDDRRVLRQCPTDAAQLAAVEHLAVGQSARWRPRNPPDRRSGRRVESIDLAGAPIRSAIYGTGPRAQVAGPWPWTLPGSTRRTITARRRHGRDRRWSLSSSCMSNTSGCSCSMREITSLTLAPVSRSKFQLMIFMTVTYTWEFEETKARAVLTGVRLAWISVIVR